MSLQTAEQFEENEQYSEAYCKVYFRGVSAADCAGNR